jgi:hypothetical protein
MNSTRLATSRFVPKRRSGTASVIRAASLEASRCHSLRLLDRIRHDRVHPQAFGTPLDREYLREHIDAGVGGAGVRLQGHRDRRLRRRNVDDPGAGLSKKSMRRAQHVERAQRSMSTTASKVLLDISLAALIVKLTVRTTADRALRYSG